MTCCDNIFIGAADKMKRTQSLFLFDRLLFDHLNNVVLDFTQANDALYTFQTPLISECIRVFTADACRSPTKGFWVEVLMKHFRSRRTNNRSLFLHARPHPFPRVRYAACHPNPIKLRWFRFSSWTNTRQLMQKHMCTQTRDCVSPPFTQKNNESAYRAGSFTDLVQSQVPALKSLVMQMTTSCSSPLWCASSTTQLQKHSVCFYFSPAERKWN